MRRMTWKPRIPSPAYAFPTLVLAILAVFLATGCTGNFGPFTGSGQGNPPTLPGTVSPTLQTTPPTTPLPALSTPATASPTPTPQVIPVPSAVLPPAQISFLDDQAGKQIISLAIDSYEQKQSLYYPSGFEGTMLSRKDAAPGYRFVLVGVRMQLVGIHGEGMRTNFMTPLASSFALWDGALLINATDPQEFASGSSYYLKDEGSLYHSRLIDKETPGDGLLVFEVPTTLVVRNAMIRFCPVNDPQWSSTGYPRFDDDWDCVKGTLAWRLS